MKKIFLVFLAILLPPVVALIYGRPTEFLINIAWCLCFWIPGIIHAFVIMENNDVW